MSTRPNGEESYALIAIAAGSCAAIVTYLEMRERPRARALPDTVLRLTRWVQPDLDRYRALFARVGAPWLWFSRLVIDDAALGAIVLDPAVEVFAVVDPRGIEVGMIELDFRTLGTCEIAYLAIVPELTRQGLGRWMMAQALTRAWREGVSRVWLHTCSLDHPSALGFYRAQGFVPFKREVETFPDPRLSGHLPRDAAPQIPLIEPS